MKKYAYSEAFHSFHLPQSLISTIQAKNPPKFILKPAKHDYLNGDAT